MNIKTRENNYNVEQRTLADYHRRLTLLLERMERLEASLQTIPLVSRATNMYTEERDIFEESSHDDQHSKEDKDVETEKEQNECQKTKNSM